MHSALPRPAFVLAAMALLLTACASANHRYSDVGAIAGSTESLQPRIASASTTSRDVVVSFSVPQRSYVSFVSVRTQSSLSILGAAPVGAPTALEPMDAGDHKVLLATSPVRVGSNVRRTARPLNAGDPRLEPGETAHPGHYYTLVVATAKPLSLTDLQESVADIDLVAPDDATVLQRVAEAIGGHSLGAWAASAARVAISSAPF